MNNKVIIGIVVTLLIIAGIIAVVSVNSRKSSTTTKNPDTHMAMNNVAPEKSNETTQETNDITYKGFAVVQKSIKVRKGTTVTWTNQDDAMHDVTPDIPTADFKTSTLFGKNKTYQVTFNAVGTYTYHCSPHPYMKGSIEVIES